MNMRLDVDTVVRDARLPVIRFLRRRYGMPTEEAEALYHDAVVLMIEKLDASALSYPSRSLLTKLAHGLAANRARTVSTRARILRDNPGELGPDVEQPDGVVVPDRVLSRLANLDEELTQIFLLRTVLGHTSREVAKRFGLTPGSVDRRRDRVKRELHKALDEERTPRRTVALLELLRPLLAQAAEWVARWRRQLAFGLAGLLLTGPLAPTSPLARVSDPDGWAVSSAGALPERVDAAPASMQAFEVPVEASAVLLPEGGLPTESLSAMSAVPGAVAHPNKESPTNSAPPAPVEAATAVVAKTPAVLEEAAPVAPVDRPVHGAAPAVISVVLPSPGAGTDSGVVTQRSTDELPVERPSSAIWSQRTPIVFDEVESGDLFGPRPPADDFDDETVWAPEQVAHNQVPRVHAPVPVAMEGDGPCDARSLEGEGDCEDLPEQALVINAVERAARAADWSAVTSIADAYLERWPFGSWELRARLLRAQALHEARMWPELVAAASTMRDWPELEAHLASLDRWSLEGLVALGRCDEAFARRGRGELSLSRREVRGACEDAEF